MNSIITPQAPVPNTPNAPAPMQVQPWHNDVVNNFQQSYQTFDPLAGQLASGQVQAHAYNGPNVTLGGYVNANDYATPPARGYAVSGSVGGGAAQQEIPYYPPWFDGNGGDGLQGGQIAPPSSVGPYVQQWNGGQLDPAKQAQGLPGMQKGASADQAFLDQQAFDQQYGQNYQNQLPPPPALERNDIPGLGQPGLWNGPPAGQTDDMRALPDMRIPSSSDMPGGE